MHERIGCEGMFDRERAIPTNGMTQAGAPIETGICAVHQGADHAAPRMSTCRERQAAAGPSRRTPAWEAHSRGRFLYALDTNFEATRARLQQCSSETGSPLETLATYEKSECLTAYTIFDWLTLGNRRTRFSGLLRCWMSMRGALESSSQEFVRLRELGAAHASRLTRSTDRRLRSWSRCTPHTISAASCSR